MKEKIYTIPVNEAYETVCACPLCYLADKLENEAIDYALGAAMMEPDYRIESNDKGFCQKHFSMLYQRPNKLSLALVLETHLAEIQHKLQAFEKEANALTESKGGLFRKNNTATDFAEKLSQKLGDMHRSCIICDKIDRTMERYIDVLFYLWDNDPAFHEKFKNAQGVCLPHMEMLIAGAPKYLNQKKAGLFLSELFHAEKKHLADLQDDVHKFTLKFDYRNQDMDWGTAKDAPIRTIEKITSSLPYKEIDA